jgi:hypothetical protein
MLRPRPTGTTGKGTVVIYSNKIKKYVDSVGDHDRFET